MTQHVRLGMLTPSSNTVLEPVTTAMTAEIPEVTSHFARFRVRRISLDQTDLAQFDTGNIVAAAEMLADAKVDVIAWSGTSGSWLGEDRDRQLCDDIQAKTGIKATTSVLAMNEVLRRTEVNRVALVTPYTGDVQDRIVANYARLGIDCSLERHLGDPGNFSFASWSETQIAELIVSVANDKPDAIMIMCTNFRAAPLVDELERHTGIPIYDSISTVVWKSLGLAGVSPAGVNRWGSLFRSLPAFDPTQSSAA